MLKLSLLLFPDEAEFDWCIWGTQERCFHHCFVSHHIHSSEKLPYMVCALATRITAIYIYIYGIYRCMYVYTMKEWLMRLTVWSCLFFFLHHSSQDKALQCYSYILLYSHTNPVYNCGNCLPAFFLLYFLRHLEQFWGASKNLWSSIWSVFYWLSGESFFNVYVYGTRYKYNWEFVAIWLFSAGVTLLGIATFIVVNVFFMVLDLTGKPSVFLKYKIQEEKAVPVSEQCYICGWNVWYLLMVCLQANNVMNLLKRLLNNGVKSSVWVCHIIALIILVLFKVVNTCMLNIALKHWISNFPCRCPGKNTKKLSGNVHLICLWLDSFISWWCILLLCGEEWMLAMSYLHSLPLYFIS